ncbi:hypothetical protein PGTUg99_031105 [Puccinia graminis f. sp. tritici]|uniref:Uncharacterized protein n=1 Tax=Puccinia graminis f. sp. tritici TaxID=56615 RepID=A0A5B0LXG6_PUCGR|nr:hypothetical protein PGTUg99_031105 [Puccinia graminis f. sp. tritici]
MCPKGALLFSRSSNSNHFRRTQFLLSSHKINPSHFSSGPTTRAAHQATCTSQHRWSSTPLSFLISALSAHISGGPLRYATLLAQKAAFSGKSGKKPLKTAVAQRSGPFFVAHTRSVSGVVAEFRYATLIANSDSAALRYTNRYIADSQIRASDVEWESFFQMDGRLWESAIQ